MSFMQTFGATAFALFCYAVILTISSFLISDVHDDDDAFYYGIIYGIIYGLISGIMFAVMFVVWYKGVPVPAWMR